MSILRDKGGLEDKWCRSLGLGPRLVGSLMMTVAHGMRQTRPDWANGYHSPIDEELLHDEDETETGTSPQQEQPSGLGDGQSVNRSRDGPA